VTKPPTIAKAASATALLAASLALSGCITLFPKAAAVQLYRFGEQPPAVDAKAATGAPFNLQRAQTTFERAAQSDAILTSNGSETAFLSGSRWVAPAVVLFDEAVDRAFNAGGPAHLIPRGETSLSGASLKLTVETFEARYSGAKDAAPTVVVRVHGILMRVADRHPLAEQTFEVRKAADDNRMGAIVSAFDAATNDAIGQIVAWTELQGEPTATPAAT
jgi:cholesterol transport system auxiliary component